MPTTGIQPTDRKVLFDDLFERHHRLVFGYLLGRCGNRDTAADMVQDTFVRVWSHIDDVPQIADDERHRWLLAIAKRVSVDAARRSKVREPISQIPPLQEPRDSAPSPHRAAEAADSLMRLNDAIGELPDEWRTVLVLNVLEGLSSVEIAGMLGLPEGTVRSHLFHARSRLGKKVGL
ncbi:MAG: RNA polymerase sigma factor [Fimbriimonas sp.]|nr:RNA polymerase sigma factor [Fimbriimonas sp.]